MTTPISQPTAEPEREPPDPIASLIDLFVMPGDEDIEFELVPMSIGLRAAELD